MIIYEIHSAIRVVCSYYICVCSVPRMLRMRQLSESNGRTHMCERAGAHQWSKVVLSANISLSSFKCKHIMMWSVFSRRFSLWPTTRAATTFAFAFMIVSFMIPILSRATIYVRHETFVFFDSKIHRRHDQIMLQQVGSQANISIDTWVWLQLLCGNLRSRA